MDGASRPSVERACPLSWLTAALVAMVHLALLRPMQGPMIFGDEAAYLGMARFLTGHAPDLRLASSAMRYGAYLSTGYSVALAPFLALARDPMQTYRFALAFNAALAAATFLLLEVFARRALSLRAGPACLAALAACAHPVLVLQPLIAWPEALLAALLPALVLSAERLYARPTAGRALVPTVIAVATYWAHQRTLGVLLVLMLTAIVFRPRLPRRALTAIVVGGAAGLLVVRAVNGGVWAGVSRVGEHPTEIGVLSGLLKSDGLLQALLSAAGLFWYLAASTCGLALLGAWSLWRRVRTSPEAHRGAAVVLVVSAALFATSAAFVIIPDRVDKLFYGRYFEPALGLLLVAGIAAILQRPRPRIAVVISALPLLLGLALLVSRGAPAFAGPLNSYCVIGLAPAIALAGRLRLLWIAAGASVVTASLLWSAHRRPRAAASVFLLLFAAGSLVAYRGLVLPDNLVARTSLQIPARLRELPADAAVAYDERHLVDRGFFAYSFEIPPRHERYFDSVTASPPVELVITTRSWAAARGLGARLLYPENGQDQGLWVLPGRMQTELAARGALFSDDPRGPLPPAACRSRLELASRVPRVPTGATRTVDLRLRHAGREAPWISARALDDPGGAVRLAIRWYEGEVVRSEQRVELPRSLAPGETVMVRLPLVAEDTEGRPLSSRTYQVRIELVQELVQWFASVGDAAQVLTVEVTARGLAGGWS